MTFAAPPPLEGVMILDLSRVLAGPFATMMLADMGATVIKIEEPTRGDDTRGYGPPFVEGESTYYMSFNRNKRSVAVDMKTPEGRGLIHKLALEADIVFENFRPGIAERMGLGYETLSRMKPELIYVSVSGFGQTGPESARPGYDLMAQGMGGLMSLTGPEDGMPSKVGVSQADLVAGMYACQGALLALLSRNRTGRGQHVDVCLLDGQISLLSFIATGFLNTGKEPSRQGNRHASIAPYQTYEASDGYFNVAVGNDRLFEEFAREVGHASLAQDERFKTNAGRVAHIAELNAVLEPAFKSRTVAQWVEHFDRARIPTGPILSVKQALENPQTVARGMVTEVEHPTIGTVKLLGNPVKMSATPARTELAPPLLGEHTEQVLRVLLKMKDDEIAGLEERGVVKQWRSEEEPGDQSEAVGGEAVAAGVAAVAGSEAGSDAGPEAGGAAGAGETAAAAAGDAATHGEAAEAEMPGHEAVAPSKLAILSASADEDEDEDEAPVADDAHAADDQHAADEAHVAAEPHAGEPAAHEDLGPDATAEGAATEEAEAAHAPRAEPGGSGEHPDAASADAEKRAEPGGTGVHTETHPKDEAATGGSQHSESEKSAAGSTDKPADSAAGKQAEHETGGDGHAAAPAVATRPEGQQ